MPLAGTFGGKFGCPLGVWESEHPDLDSSSRGLVVSLLLTTCLSAHDASASCDVYTCLVVHITIFRVPRTYAPTPHSLIPPTYPSAIYTRSISVSRFVSSIILFECFLPGDPGSFPLVCD